MVRKNEDVTHSVDVYALGIITYELMTGLPPYIDEDPMKVLMAHVLEPVPQIRDVDPSVSTAVASVLKRCLAKTPVERYRTAGAFARALQEAASVVADTIPAQPVEADDTDDNSVTVRAASQRSRSLGAFPTPPSGTLRRPDLPEPSLPDEPDLFEPEPTGHGQYTGSLSPIGDDDELDEPAVPDRRRGCITAAGIITLVIAGIGLTAFALSGGDYASVVSQLDRMGIIDQEPTNTPQPTVTLTPQPPTPGESEGRRF
jgi:serine/threonine-protein kinase